MEKSTIGFLVVISLLFPLLFGHLTKVPVVSDASEKFWNHAEPAIVETKNFLEEAYQRIFGSESNSKTGPGESSSSSNESLQSVDPPDVTVSMSSEKSTYYLGDNPSFEITVTNNGGPCEVEYTAFESQPESGSFQLSSNESKTVTETGRQAREIGSWNASVDVTATNEEETDQASDWVSVEVNVKPYNPDFSPEWYEDVIVEYSELIRGGIGRIIWETFSNPANSYEELYVTPDSKTVEKVTNVLINRHPNDRVLKAKEIYYWVQDWITYEGDWEYDITNYHQIELPNETIWDQDGVCLNYALVLASIYKDAGFRVKLVALADHPYKEDHAINMLYLPNAQEVRHTPSYPDWVTLDATNSPVFGEIPSWINEYETVYEAEVE